MNSFHFALRMFSFSNQSRSIFKDLFSFSFCSWIFRVSFDLKDELSFSFFFCYLNKHANINLKKKKSGAKLENFPVIEI